MIHLSQVRVYCYDLQVTKSAVFGGLFLDINCRKGAKGIHNFFVTKNENKMKLA